MPRAHPSRSSVSTLTARTHQPGAETSTGLEAWGKLTSGVLLRGGAAGWAGRGAEGADEDQVCP